MYIKENKILQDYQELLKHGMAHVTTLNSIKDNISSICTKLHSEKSPVRPMLFYSTNYWQQFWVQFIV